MKKNLRNILGIAILSVAVLALVGLFIFQSGIFNKEPEVEVLANNCYDKTLHVITDADYMPYSFFDANGKASGHDVELIALIANEMQMNLDLELMDWEEAIRATDEGKADVLMTCDYSDSFAGVDVLLKTEPVSSDEFIVYSKQPINTADVLYEKKCAVMRNGNVMSQIEMFNLEKNCVMCDDNRGAMAALENGEADCAIMRYTVGEALLKELGYKDIRGNISIGKSYMCFCVSDNNEELTGRINEALETLKVNGEVERLQNKWLTTFIHTYTLAELIRNNIWAVIIVLSLIAASAILFIRSERSRIKAAEERNQFVRIIENLANDFECVNYVELNENRFEDEAILIRTSDVLKRNIPGWEKETNFSNRLDMFADAVVEAEDREEFERMTKRDIILSNLYRDGAYFVNFRAIIDGTPQYYQMKFSTVNNSNQVKAIVVGIHNVDAETRNEIATKEALQNALSNEREIEQKLAKDKALLDYFVEAYAGAYSVDIETDSLEILRADNNFAESLTMDGTRDDMLRFINEHVHPEDREKVLKNLEKEYIFGRLRQEDNYTFTFREVFGETERTMRCLIVKGVDIQHVAVGFMDITEELERERQVQKMLEAANRSKSEFLFNMSHDIRTPMNAIIGFTDLATRHVSNTEKVGDYLTKIKNSSNHLLELINEVLDMSRVESGKLSSELKTVSIRNEAEKMMTIYRETAEMRNIRLSLIADDISHDSVIADELHVNRIISNILGNAIKYTMPGGSVSYSIAELKSDSPGYGKYEFIIEDTGIGMSKDFLEMIFESFSREESETVHDIQGTGLGMSIVKRLVDFLDGTIEIESEKGKGTKVTIMLHMKLAGDDTAYEETADTSFDMTGMQVLLAEDNDLNREIATELLNEQGMTVDVAVNGREAVSTIKNRGVDYYDFVLMDIQMPFMDGYEATKEIRKLPGSEKLIIIALSANAFEEDRQKSFDAGMNDHIAKPINVKELFSAIARAFKNSGE